MVENLSHTAPYCNNTIAEKCGVKDTTPSIRAFLKTPTKPRQLALTDSQLLGGSVLVPRPYSRDGESACDEVSVAYMWQDTPPQYTPNKQHTTHNTHTTHTYTQTITP